MATGAGPSSRVAERLLAEGRLSQAWFEEALDLATRKNVRFEEALIEIGVGEPTVLKLLAATFKTQFVTTEKLARAAIEPTVLAMVPRRVAERRLVLPVLHDVATSTLCIVTADPDDLEALKEVQLGAGVRDVRALVARPAAIEAALAKHYAGVKGAFLPLTRRDQGPPEIDGMDVIDFENRVEPLPPAPRRGTYGPLDAAADGPVAEGPAGLGAPSTSAIPHGVVVGRSTAAQARPRWQNFDTSASLAMGVSTAGPAQTASMLHGGAGSERASVPAERAPTAAERAPARAEPGRPPRAATSPRSAPMASGDVLEVVNVVVSVFETWRAELRGHSAHTARLVRTVYERMGMPVADTYGAVLAALLHDLGKAGGRHLTPLNVSLYDAHRGAAERVLTTRLLESVRLPAGCTDGLAHMYEQFDGRGFPERRAGHDIPLESRVLAVCDTFSDLTTNPNNPYRGVLSHPQGCQAIRTFAGTVFDPNVVDVFAHVVLGADIRRTLLGERPRVLLVDADPESATALELRLLESGFDVVIARTHDEALDVLQARGGADAVACEMNLGVWTGLDLLERVRELPRFQQLPFLLQTHEAQPAVATRATELGASDYVVKPVAAQVIEDKLQRLIDAKRQARKGRGVKGSLQDMSLPDIVQVLQHGRKSGTLRISTPEVSGEITFHEGEVRDASCGGQCGDEAFYSLLWLSSGDFELDPEGRAHVRTTRATTEMLLLEGMRRLDEAASDDASAARGTISR